MSPAHCKELSLLYLWFHSLSALCNALRPINTSRQGDPRSQRARSQSVSSLATPCTRRTDLRQGDLCQTSPPPPCRTVTSADRAALSIIEVMTLKVSAQKRSSGALLSSCHSPLKGSMPSCNTRGQDVATALAAVWLLLLLLLSNQPDLFFLGFFFFFFKLHSSQLAPRGTSSLVPFPNVF